ncbi:Holliday junction resolvase RuvX [Demequina sp. SYSU T00039]|uniref:Putative pre-16S rRNA nuclease n=1 Tax=Demequina lignilytica TaxID=3051663 RepID=A0AAW7M193_9MICO|nr:Holliday junction resolvase RuvX [Demequina sp. SYSU T00039]MDN4486717.1 Holliday junction resolvase RuvX [Demequina sp. SYSU T00039]
MRRGVALSVDVGTVRIGVAASDPDRLMAFPVDTVQRGKGDVARVAAIAEERSATAIFVGLPRKLSGQEGASAADARGFAEALVELVDGSVRLIDERFSTATASQAMRSAGRDARRQRTVIDQAAAVVILENAMDVDKNGNLDAVTIEVPRKGNDD